MRALLPAKGAPPANPGGNCKLCDLRVGRRMQQCVVPMARERPACLNNDNIVVLGRHHEQYLRLGRGRLSAASRHMLWLCIRLAKPHKFSASEKCNSVARTQTFRFKLHTDSQSSADKPNSL